MSFLSKSGKFGRLRLEISGLFRQNVVSIFKKRRIIYIYKNTTANVRSPCGLTLIAINNESYRKTGSHALEGLSGVDQVPIEERLTENAEILIATQKQEVLAWICVVDERHLSRWHMPLQAGDAIIYGAGTRRQSRGQGLIGILVKAIADRHASQPGRLLLDCFEWNTSARRAFEKYGFEQLHIT